MDSIKIMTPIDNIRETTTLINAGATEFYCDCQIDGINFGSQRARRKCVVKSFEELVKINKIVKKFNIPLYIILNKPYFEEDKIHIKVVEYM